MTAGSADGLREPFDNPIDTVTIDATSPTMDTVAAVAPSSSASSGGSGSGGKAPLRRAIYVNVDKLVRSQYDLDLQLLQDELAKLKAAAAESASKEDQMNVSPGSGGDDSTRKSEGSTSGASKPTTNAWSGTNLSVLPGGPLKAPLPGKYHQSRLQPPRDGFNLCL